MSNIFSAHREWSERPADERFETLDDLLDYTRTLRDASVMRQKVNPRDLVFGSEGPEDLRVHSSVDDSHYTYGYRPTAWAMTQLCEYLSVPGAYIRSLPGQLAAANLQHAADIAPRSSLSVMVAQLNGPTKVDEGRIFRCVTTPAYQRLWDYEVVRALKSSIEDGETGWHRPRAYDEDVRGPAGIYGSDRNIFVFMVNDDVRIDDGSKDGLARGFICWNSEVRQMSFGFRAFLYRYVCGNHIIWDAQDLFSVRMAHIGRGMGREATRALGSVLEEYAETSAKQEQQTVSRAIKYFLGPDVDSVVSELTRSRWGWKPKQVGELISVIERRGGNPTNLWDLVNAGTSLSQTKYSNADERRSYDERVGRLLELVQ